MGHSFEFRCMNITHSDINKGITHERVLCLKKTLINEFSPNHVCIPLDILKDIIQLSNSYIEPSTENDIELQSPSPSPPPSPLLQPRSVEPTPSLSPPTRTYLYPGPAVPMRHNPARKVIHLRQSDSPRSSPSRPSIMLLSTSLDPRLSRPLKHIELKKINFNKNLQSDYILSDSERDSLEATTTSTSTPTPTTTSITTIVESSQNNNNEMEHETQDKDAILAMDSDDKNESNIEMKGISPTNDFATNIENIYQEFIKALKV